MSAHEPTILCIESSGTNCGVALVRNGELVSVYSHWIAHIHDQQLATMVEQVLKATQTSALSLDAVAVSEGPGSFTGLRIGVSLAKALCFQNKPRLIAVPTLGAVAHSARALARAYRKIIVIVPSQRDKFYLQTFDVEAQPVDEIRLLETSEVRACIDDESFVCGPAAETFGAVQTPSELRRLSVSFLVEPAVRMYAAGQFVDAHTFVPRYVQDFVPKTVGSE